MDRYSVIINAICEARGIEKEQLIKILEDKNYRYLLFLLLKKYNCINSKKLNNYLKLKDKTLINSEIDKAKERFMVNSYFRNSYFEVDDIVKKTINTRNHIL